TQINSCPKQVFRGASCRIAITLNAAATGPNRGTLTVTDSDPSSPQVMTLEGSGTMTELAPSYPGLNFPHQWIGEVGRPLSATLTNHDVSSLRILGIQTVGNFSQVNDCGLALGPGASCTIDVSFVPTNSVPQLGSLAVVAGERANLFSVRLRGQGVVAHLSEKD